MKLETNWYRRPPCEFFSITFRRNSIDSCKLAGLKQDRFTEKQQGNRIGSNDEGEQCDRKDEQRTDFLCVVILFLTGTRKILRFLLLLLLLNVPPPPRAYYDFYLQQEEHLGTARREFITKAIHSQKQHIFT